MRLILPLVVFLLSANLELKVAAQNTEASVIGSTEYRLPDQAAAAGIDGTMKIAITVDKTGAVKRTTILGGPSWPCSSDPEKLVEGVRKDVKEIVSNARFSPATKNGKPVETDLILTFMIGNAYKSAVKQREAEEAVRSGKAPPKLIEGGVLNGKTLRLPKPSYPSAARSERLGGSVPVEVLIDEQGNVIAAGAIGGHPLLQPGTREAACNAKFAPTVLKGQPVKVTGVIVYNYVP